MVLDTVTANPEGRSNRGAETPQAAATLGAPRGGWPLGSRLGRLIVILNVLGLAILIGGALILNELRQGLVNASLASLSLEGHVIANVIDQDATVGEPEPALEADDASNVLQALPDPASQRARLYDADGQLLADSFVVADRRRRQRLPPARKPGQTTSPFNFQGRSMARRAALRAPPWTHEVHRALNGETVSGTRLAEDGQRVVSVSIPIHHVRAVLGVLTLQAGDVDQIIAAERLALLPFISDRDRA